MLTMTGWKGQANDLRGLAHDVMTAGSAEHINARTAAQVLSGVMGLIAQRFGVEAMQRTCAELVRFTPAWCTKLGRLPHDHDGQVSEPMRLVSVVARGVLPLCGDAALRQALSYWAIESDTASWADLAAGK